MDSESEHDHREDESASEAEEEVAEVPEPKSAMKKTREVLPPVERPELP
jgi:translation initiation factor 2 subunit 3